MKTKASLTLKAALTRANEFSERAWLYLLPEKNWDLQSPAAVLESEEVPPELEDNPEAGIPVAAKQQGLVQILPVSVLQDIVANVQHHKRDTTEELLLEAFLYYYKHDAFISL